MLDNTKINEIIDETINEIDITFNNKLIPQIYLNYFYLIAVGMILKYGEKYKKGIFKLFKNLEFITDFKHLLDSLTKNNYEIIKSNLLNKKQFFTLIDFTKIIKNGLNNPNFIIFSTGLSRNKKANLENLIKELNLLLTSYSKCISLKDNKPYFRISLSQIKLNSQLLCINSNDALENAINILQTEDIIKMLLSLKKFKINNPKFNIALNYLINIDEESYHAYGYEIVTNLLRKLYENLDFKMFLDDSMLKGQINLIKNDLDNILGNGSFSKLSELLNNLQEEVNAVTKNINPSAFESGTLYTFIKNNYIEKYLKSNYIYAN